MTGAGGRDSAHRGIAAPAGAGSDGRSGGFATPPVAVAERQGFATPPGAVAECRDFVPRRARWLSARASGLTPYARAVDSR
ncbi:hypothetical protein [Streptomyces niveus]|uniref:hypothetical protein n=1 Tax=Streptomyces niveus TaxID=193462 RepID=UPI0034244261